MNQLDLHEVEQISSLRLFIISYSYLLYNNFHNMNTYQNLKNTFI